MFFSTLTHRHCTGFVLVVVGILIMDICVGVTRKQEGLLAVEAWFQEEENVRSMDQCKIYHFRNVIFIVLLPECSRYLL